MWVASGASTLKAFTSTNGPRVSRMVEDSCKQDMNIVLLHLKKINLFLFQYAMATHFIKKFSPCWYNLKSRRLQNIFKSLDWLNPMYDICIDNL